MTHTTKLTRTLLVAMILLTAGTVRAARPNIVFILADDMGYGDVHALNPKSSIPTPNLDRLAEAGMTFTDAHTPSAVCTPTRYGLLTGRYCWRSRLKKGVQNGYGPPLIETDRPTVASFLAKAGYTTGIVGKWHLGLGFVRSENSEFDFTKPITDGPTHHGFHYSWIIPASLDFPPYVYIENTTITGHPFVPQSAQSFPAFLRKGERGSNLNMENCLDDLQAKASEFIQNHADDEKPFFLYFPLTAPHKPVLPHPRFRGRTQLGPYGDFVVQVDDTVGRVLKTIDDTGIADQTLLIYTSDNGSFMRRDDPGPNHAQDETVQAFRSTDHTSNYVYRGTKADIWEAGHRVPFFARWPGTVAANSRCDNTVCVTDFFATAGDIVEESLPKQAGPDSFSLLPLLKGVAPSTPRPPVIHHSAAGMFSIRDGQWKLVAGNGSGGREKPPGKPFLKPYALFDMRTDESETTNVIDDNADVAARLEAELTRIRDSGSSR